MPDEKQEPIQGIRNQYMGPNAHLLSLQQTPREDVSLWKSFHNAYITTITFALNRRLPKGYIAVNEQSLQIQAKDLWGAIHNKPAVYPDSAVYDKVRRALHSSTDKPTALLDTPTW